MKFKNYREVIDKIEEVYKRIEEKRKKIRYIELNRERNYYQRLYDQSRGKKIEEDRTDQEIEVLKQQIKSLQLEYNNLFIEFRNFRYDESTNRWLTEYEWGLILQEFVKMQIKVEDAGDVSYIARFYGGRELQDSLTKNSVALRQKYQDLSYAIDTDNEDLFNIANSEIYYYQSQLNAHHWGEEDLKHILSSDEIKGIIQRKEAYVSAKKEQKKGINSDNPYIKFNALMIERLRILESIPEIKKITEEAEHKVKEGTLSDNELHSIMEQYHESVAMIYYDVLNNPENTYHNSINNIVIRINELRNRFPKIASEIPYDPKKNGVGYGRSGELWKNAIQYEIDRTLSKEIEHEQKPTVSFEGFKEETSGSISDSSKTTIENEAFSSKHINTATNKKGQDELSHTNDNIGEEILEKQKEDEAREKSDIDDYEAKKQAYEEVSETKELVKQISPKSKKEIDTDLDNFEAEERRILNSKHFTDEQKREMIEELYSEFDQYTEQNPELSERHM